MKKRKLPKLSLSKKTISSLDSESAKRIVGGDDTLTRFWTPTTCGAVSTGNTCYSRDNSGTVCKTGCATC